jgi:putative ABC transport system permease protein
MQQGLLVASAGLVAGGTLAAVAARMIRGLLYGVTAADPIAWLAAAALLLAVSALANLIPAWRASSVDPSEALRIE